MIKKNNEKLRSRQWFNNPDNIEMTALYLERYLNYGITREELQSDKPIVAIAQTGSDLSPCNRHHLELAKRVRDGIIASGGVPMEIPVHPIQETGKRPTAFLDRNLAYLSLVESLYGYPIDGVVLMIGCDKTTPALLMAASLQVNIPAIALSVGPMLNSWHKGKRAGSGSTIWDARQLYAKGEIDNAGFVDLVALTAPSVGYCNTMGTASTMNSLAEALGMQLPGGASIPAPYKERGQMAYKTGMRIVEMIHQDIKPSHIMTKEIFYNAIVVNSAIGGSTNAPIHLNAISRHLGFEINNNDWQAYGYNIPLLVNVQPAGEYLSEDFYHAGGLPSVIGELLQHKLIPFPHTVGVNEKSYQENYSNKKILNPLVIKSVDRPIKQKAGFLNLKGNLFDSAIMKTSVISEDFENKYLNKIDDPNAFELRAVVFDGTEDYHSRIDDPALNIDEMCILIMRGAGPIGYPGGAEVVNMRPPNYLLKKGITNLPCLGDGRQSGTSGSPSILNASPEAPLNGGMAIVQTGDKIRIDLNTQSANILISEQEYFQRIDDLKKKGGYKIVPSQTPWQEIFRENVLQLNEGMILKQIAKYQDIANKMGVPRDSH